MLAWFWTTELYYSLKVNSGQAQDRYGGLWIGLWKSDIVPRVVILDVSFNH